MSVFVDHRVYVCNTIHVPVEDRTKFTYIVCFIPYICTTHYFGKVVYPHNTLFRQSGTPCHTSLAMLAQHFVLHWSALLDATPHGLVETSSIENSGL